MINWPVEFLELVSLQQEKKRESQGVSPSSFFAAKAAPEQITDAEAVLAITLDQEHREFLLHSDGWVGFSADIDLFSTQDFLGSKKFATAKERVTLMDRGVLGIYASSRNDLFPIGMSSSSSDLLLMVNDKTGKIQAKVIWFANELIEEFNSFEQMFITFKAYHHKAIEYWRGRNNPTPQVK